MGFPNGSRWAGWLSRTAADHQNAKPSEAEICSIVLGPAAVQARAAVFERVFRETGEPVTGRWPSQFIWMQTHPKYEPWGVLVERKGAPVAAALLTRQWRGFWKIGKPAGWGDPLHFAAVDEDAARGLAKSILEAAKKFGGPWEIEISDLPSSDPVAAYIRSYWPRSQSWLTPPAPHILFATGEPLTTYISRNTRSAVAKARNRIEREGIELREAWTSDPEQILKFLPHILDVNRRRDHQLRQRSFLDDPASERFFMAFVAEHAGQGLIDLLTIHLNGQLAAFALCLLDNAEYSVLANRAAPDWLRYSPGTIANAEVVRHAYEKPGICGVNWGAGPQRYKLSGKAALQVRQTLCAWSSAAVPLLFDPCYKLGSAIVHTLKHISSAAYPRPS